MVPYFGAPEMTIALAIGISFFVSMFTINNIGAKADAIAEENLPTNKKMIIVFSPSIAMGICWLGGWIATFFLPEVATVACAIDPVYLTYLA